MNLFSLLRLASKAFLQLGPSQLSLYGLYQLGLRSGHYRRALSSRLVRLEQLDQRMPPGLNLQLLELPDPQSMLTLLGHQVEHIYREANEIVNGTIRLFGGKPVPLILSLPSPLDDWTRFETKKIRGDERDIKFTWEPGRFGWAIKLAMAYHLSKDERYAATFWSYTEKFLTSNPPYRGPHWSSAQEVAIRLVALAFAIQVFSQSAQATDKRIELIARAISLHAERIPPTLVYARSQNNNHLVTEALGLYTASAVLPTHPLASSWHSLGWKWLNHAFRTQISPDGTYTQHSTNYHRLMLQSALWAKMLQVRTFTSDAFPSDITARLESATRWLWKFLDPDTGQVPNLGHNDSAYILPLTVCSYQDYRPVIQAASRAFLRTRLLPGGTPDDMTSWLGLTTLSVHREAPLNYWHQKPSPTGLNSDPPYLLVHPQNGSWATLRVATFHSRPAHADQLHFDLWWRGLNIAIDPGTYLYNAASPWENSLTGAFVHNTVTVNGKEFMLRAGRFLYLDWAQGKMLTNPSAPGEGWHELIAQHDGYRKIHLTHTRRVTACNDGTWEVMDRLDGSPGRPYTARLHWLLPDWEYVTLEPPATDDRPAVEIRIKSPHGWVSLKCSLESAQGNLQRVPAMTFQLVRAGALLVGSGKIAPINGWTSLTYGDKIPALACIVEVTQDLPLEITSIWSLPGDS